MTLNELIDALDTFVRQKPGNGAKEIKVWLPGSRIELSGMPFEFSSSTVLIEGNLEPGSALERND